MPNWAEQVTAIATAVSAKRVSDVRAQFCHMRTSTNGSVWRRREGHAL